MSLNEFDIIDRYFNRVTPGSSNVLVGIGDDAAILKQNTNEDVVVSIDTLVAGVHFPLNTPAYDIAWKALAVNLSDMAAMGAHPAWFTLALTMPEASTSWLDNFSEGLFSLADQYQISLVGGDTTRGPLSITIQIAGHVKNDTCLLRTGAQPGDDIYISGTLGDAAMALSLLQSDQPVETIPPELLKRLNRPEPQVKLGRALIGVAHCAIDISDGLFQDLQHMLLKRTLGAKIDTSSLPQSKSFQAAPASQSDKMQMQLYGGDDYELCFCAPIDKRDEINLLTLSGGFTLTKVGTVVESAAIFDLNGQKIKSDHVGYQHFT